MSQLAMTIVLLFVVYFIGYAMGRKDIVDDIKEITRELKEKEKGE